jgi:choline dehydrogenase-like flavoprotein
MQLKERLSQPGYWQFGLVALGEVLPYHDNQVRLDTTQQDKYGLPLLEMDVEWRENEFRMGKDMTKQAMEMLEVAGLSKIEPIVSTAMPATGIHEMGTARMGNDPKTSVLNRWNQIHAIKNVFVTDGSCMTSSANQNPSLTYMALTARAVDYAVKELNKRNL